MIIISIITFMDIILTAALLIYTYYNRRFEIVLALFLTVKILRIKNTTKKYIKEN